MIGVSYRLLMTWLKHSFQVVDVYYAVDILPKVMTGFGRQRGAYFIRIKKFHKGLDILHACTYIKICDVA